MTATPGAALYETHSAVVLLLGDRAYKVKKPVDLGFLDFTTREQRQYACHREVELNGRLTPDVYLGVADVTGTDGELCEHMVVMRRMPTDRRLSTLVEQGEDVDDELRTVAKDVAAFHSRCARGPDIDRAGTRDALAGRWRANIEAVRAFRGGILDPTLFDGVERLSAQFLAGREPLFDERIGAGCIVDGHGDLLADDIFCLADGPRVLDCLDFDDELRHVDRVDDAAFLAADLEHLGAPAAAERFLSWYQDFSGDNAPQSLVHHYLAYRSFTRSKVSCLRHAQGDAKAGATAATFLALAHRQLRAGAVLLLLVGGSPGTGKTTVSGAVAGRLGLTMLRSDLVRKETAGLDPWVPAPAGPGAGIYGPRETQATYEALLQRAGIALGRGESVVLDATWGDRTWRDAAAELASRTHSTLVQVRCTVPPAVARARICARSDASDADVAIAELLRRQADAWPEAFALDTRDPLELCAERVTAELARAVDGTGTERRAAS